MASHYTVVLVIGLRTSSSHRYAGLFPYWWRCFTWTSASSSQTVCSLSVLPCSQFQAYVFSHIVFPREWEHSVGKPQSFSDWWRKSPWNLVLLQACMLFAQHTPVIPPPLLSLTLHNSGKCGSAQTNPKGMCFQTKNTQKLGHHLDEDRLLNHLKETENHYAQQKTAQQNVWDFPLEFVLSQRAFCRRDCPRVKCLRNSQ